MVVFSADWVPDHELAVRAGVALDPARADPLWTPPCAPPGRACSPAGTSSTARRPRTSPRWAAATPPPGRRASSPATAPGRRPPFRSCARPRCSGSCPTWWRRATGRRRGGASSCAPAPSFAFRGSGSSRTAACCGAAACGAWCPAVRPGCRTPGPARWTSAADPCEVPRASGVAGARSAPAGYKRVMEHEEQGRRLEREADDMEERSDKVGKQIDEARSDWEAKQSDSNVPGAHPTADDQDESESEARESTETAEESDQLPEEAPPSRCPTTPAARPATRPRRRPACRARKAPPPATRTPRAPRIRTTTGTSRRHGRRALPSVW